MKKLALLTVALLSSLAGLDAATKDDHPCKQMTEGASGSSCAKITYDIVTIAACLKMGMPEGMLAIYFPFIHDLAEYEVNKLREEAEAINVSQQQALSIVSTLNNGWLIHGAMLAIVGGSYYASNALSFTNFLDDKAGIRTTVQAMLATYAVSQLAAAGIARYARGLGLFSKAKKAVKKTTTEYVY